MVRNEFNIFFFLKNHPFSPLSFNNHVLKKCFHLQKSIQHDKVSTKMSILGFNNSKPWSFAKNYLNKVWFLWWVVMNFTYHLPFFAILKTHSSYPIFSRYKSKYRQYNHIIQSKSYIACVKVTFLKSIIFKVKITFEPNVLKWVIKTIFINSNPFALLITNVKKSSSIFKKTNLVE
jgi:hypothetical protein